MAPSASTEDRGQSELVGFVLIFSVVVMTIALVGMTGFIGLNSAQDFQRTINAEQGFTTLADDIERVAGGEAPSRSTEVRIADGRLAMEDSRTKFILDEDVGFQTYTLEYDSESGTTIDYRHGALIRSDDGESVMIREPGFVLTDEEIIIPMVDLDQSGAATVGGTTSVDIRSHDGGTEVIAISEPEFESITIEIDTAHPDVWAAYFEQFEVDGPVNTVDIVDHPDEDHDQVDVEIDTDGTPVSITRHTVDIEFR